MKKWNLVSETPYKSGKTKGIQRVYKCEGVPFHLKEDTFTDYYGLKIRVTPYIGEHPIGQMYGYINRESAIEYGYEFVEDFNKLLKSC